MVAGFGNGVVRVVAGFGNDVVVVFVGFFAGMRWMRSELETVRHPGRSAAQSRGPRRPGRIGTAAAMGLRLRVPDSGLRHLRKVGEGFSISPAGKA